MDNIEELEKLKKKTNSSSENSNMGTFVKETIKSIRNILIYFVLGGLVLYVCKLNKLIVLPTDIDKEPFTIPVGSFMDKINKTMSYANDKVEKGFIPEQKTSEVFSKIFDNIQSIRFNVENKPYTILKYFAEYKQSPKSNFLANFIIAQIESLISTNYSMFSSLFTFMDETFNETMIVLIGPIITIFFSMFVVFFDYFYIIYGWFTNLHWLFKRNQTNNTKSGGPNWVTPILSIDLFVSWNLAVLLNILFLFSLPWLFSLPTIQIGLVIFTLVSILSFKGVVNETPVNSINFLYKHFIKNYKRLISIVLTLSVVVNSYNILGSSHGVFGLFVVLIIYFTTNLYKPFVYEQTTSGDTSAPPLEVPDAEFVVTPTSNSPPVFVPSASNIPITTDVRLAPNSIKGELLPQATQVGGKNNIIKMLKTLNNKYNLK